MYGGWKNSVQQQFSEETAAQTDEMKQQVWTWMDYCYTEQMLHVQKYTLIPNTKTHWNSHHSTLVGNQFYLATQGVNMFLL
jgi:hypothetical protein